MKEYSAAVYIGRFQPFHNSHLRIVNKALSVADKIIIFIGSVNVARSVKNPFNYIEREAMIRACFDTETNNRIFIYPLRDHFYFDPIWFTQIQEVLRNFLNEDKPLCVVGAYKDEGNYFYKFFQDYDKQFVQVDNVNATDIREKMFDENYGVKDYEQEIPEKLADWLLKYYLSTDNHKKFTQQLTKLKNYHRMFDAYPFKDSNNMVTVDAVVTFYGHVLVVTRKDTGDYALPGGFLKTTETIENGMIRELKEETKIRVDSNILRSKIVDSHVFDYPKRSLRGRIITHAFHIKLDIGKELPEVKGSDDAVGAHWLQIADVYRNEDKFYEDHGQIINYFVNRV